MAHMVNLLFSSRFFYGLSILDYQIITRSSGARHMPSPSLTSKVSKNSSSLVIEHWYVVFLVRGHRHLREVACISVRAFMRQMRAKLVKNSSAEKSSSFFAASRADSDTTEVCYVFRNGQFPVDLGTVRVLSSTDR